ncbi:uncharacterized protein PG998_014262 [Apiospora kogelbergensis]|uniref:uncharacterized protein n=1 Tax=Apiospora kogelbergensis TaxID=1337665 RepID=UPI00312FF759
MPGRPEGLVLTVDPNVIHKVDTANAQNLFNMWAVFSRCADSVEHGRRLENMSWRLWNRETFCCDATEGKLRQANPTSIVPQLSGSVDSVAEDEEAIEFSSESEPMEVSRPRILRKDSSASDRGRERHITPDHLEKMVVSIIQDKEPNLAPLADMSSPDVQQTPDTPTTPANEPMCHSSMEAPLKPHHRNPRLLPSQVSIPALQLRSQESTKQPGGSSGGESSQVKPKMFQLGASSGCAEDPIPSVKSVQTKQKSLSNQVSNQTQSNDGQSESDIDKSAIDESAIDEDEDGSEWEDSIEEGGKESMDDPVTFKRVPSKPNLTSHRSNLSLMFAAEQEQQRFGTLDGANASQSTSALQRARALQNVPTVKAASPNGSDDSGLEMKGGMRRTPLRPTKEIPRSTAKPIMTNANATQRQSALSPRTTRRNMLHHELTKSLRRQLLWERQQKTSTANAVLRRRHTSHDVANLKQYPEKVYMNKANATSWNQYLERGAVGGYHAQGW